MSAYSFLNVTCTLVGPGGVIDLGAGAASSEEGITITATGDKNQMTVGADGQVMHSLRADKSGVVTVRLLKTSPKNSQLMALYDAQAATSALWGQNVITVTNPVAGDSTACRACAFKKTPDLNYKTTADTVEWTFDAGFIDKVLGTY
ncbi:phage structural protein [Chitiniphilus shinanonensis]|uniref:phage structural protein n=1 Tax=Chitiniphilus shinanonensis TaxID=553088 RepID=UPI003038FFA8